MIIVVVVVVVVETILVVVVIVVVVILVEIYLHIQAGSFVENSKSAVRGCEQSCQKLVTVLVVP